MRLAVLTGLFACAAVFMLQTKSASAVTLDVLQNAKEPTAIAILEDVALKDEPIVQEIVPEEPVVVTYTVLEGDSLSVIAKKYETTWQRLFDKNTAIENPDVLVVGMVLEIPSADEQLPSRPLPAPVAPAPIARVATTSQARTTAAPAPADTAGGNRYVRGYCTWYVKNRRPDLPNNLGNAITWASRAAAQGYATGSTPAVGAVGQQGNHVVYVESVNGDGTVTVSEMNWDGWNVVSSRTVAASNFTYIY